MDILIERACGSDVHQKSITACILTPEGKEIQTFRSMTASLLAMIDWIKGHRCNHVAMESTGVLWKPIVNLLESEDIEFIVVNAAHMKALPGRKTDVKDAEWIATLLQHGLLKGSYIPDRNQRELREVVRYRRSLIQDRARELNRICKILEGANIKLSSVISQVTGVSGRAMLLAMIHGETDPERLAELARGRMKSKKDDLVLALDGRMNRHQRLMLETMIQHIDFLDEQITSLDEEVAQRLGPFQEALKRMDTIPGIGRRTAEQVLAELGADLKSRFPTAGHLCSWAGLAPGQNQSAGKHRSSKARKGNKYLRQAMTEAAQSVSRSDNYLGAQFRRIAARRGNQRAAVAVAHSMMTMIYHMLTKNEEYRELGADYFIRRQEEAIVRRTVAKLKELGYEVSVTKQASAS
jgi:transposase